MARKKTRYRDIFAGLKRPFVSAIRTFALRGGADEVRPDLRVLEDEEVGPQRRDRPARRAEQVVRARSR